MLLISAPSRHGICSSSVTLEGTEHHGSHADYIQVSAMQNWAHCKSVVLAWLAIS